MKSVLSLNSKSNSLTFCITESFEIDIWSVQSIEYLGHPKFMIVVNRIISFSSVGV